VELAFGGVRYFWLQPPELEVALFPERPSAAFPTDMLQGTLDDVELKAFFVFDMEGSHQCHEVAEAFFGTGCDVHLSPCMTPDDLQSGLGVAGLTSRG